MTIEWKKNEYVLALTIISFLLIPALISCSTSQNTMQSAEEPAIDMDGNTDLLSAVLIEEGLYNGRIDSQKDADYFRVVLTTENFISVVAEVEHDYDVFLLDENGREISRSTNGNNDDERIYRKMQAGVYFVTVAGCGVLSPSSCPGFSSFPEHYGKYTLELKIGLSGEHCNQVDDDIYEPNDTYPFAKEIQIGELQTHRILNDDDEDWIRFHAEAGSFYNISAVGSPPLASPLVSLYNSEVEFLSFGGRWLCQVSGTHLIKTRTANLGYAGSYCVYITKESFDDSNCPILGYDPYEPNDSFIGAKLITEDEVQSHLVIDSNDEDYLRFDAVHGRAYTFSISYTKNVRFYSLYIYDEFGKAIVIQSVNPPKPISFISAFNRPHYLRMSPNTNTPGGYCVSFESRKIKEPEFDTYENDDINTQATLIRHGDIQAHYIYPEGDVDWLKFYATEGHSYSLDTVENINLYDVSIRLYKGDDLDFILGTRGSLTWTCEASDYYYIRISKGVGHPTGYYKVAFAEFVP